ncbi:hypothetical protein Q8X39_18795, partial [Leptothrix discophora]|nr:hypothetical protein [Leptothrix discophora]
MASIENRSKVQVTVKNRDDLTKSFEYSAAEAVKAYVAQLKAQGLKPRLAVSVRQSHLDPGTAGAQVP